jgi:protein-L-isoaspartate(D-aspartate) O-methyltransferase
MLANDLETARLNMVAQQIRPWEVIDERVLHVYDAVPRVRFVGDDYRGLAYADIAVPLGEGEQMMRPIQEARMLQALGVQHGNSVLEIGTGSGFVTACLAQLGGTVTSYEIHPALSEAAARRLDDLGVENVELVAGDGLHASLAPGSFDVIAVTGSLPNFPSFLEDLLALGGRMFLIVGEAPAMTAKLVSRNAGGEVWREDLFETVVPALHNAPQAEHFVF